MHRNLDEIGKNTEELNYMVFDETGRGQLEYCFTEFGASGNDRWIKMIGAQFSLQYFMEMAKYNWAVANIFGEIYNTTTFRAAPVWYVYAFLNGKFGRNMVQATSDHIDIRSYASVDADNNLTIWVCNNSLDSNMVGISLSNFLPPSNGEIWVMEGADADTTGEESYDIMINGQLHPDEANARFMAGNLIDVDTSFIIKLPKSTFALIKLTPAGNDDCIPAYISPSMKLNDGGGKQIKALDKSIAVLPFKSLSDDPEKQYLEDGMIDAILLHLSKIEDLRVMSRTSVEQYRKADKTSSVISRELGVAYLMEGSFQKYGDNVRLIVQLIKTGKKGHEWANQYDRKWNDIFSVQSEVAQTIAREFHSVITPDEKELIEKVPTTNLTAYDLFIMANEYRRDYEKTLKRITN